MLKFCLSNKCSAPYLRKADQIKFPARDLNMLPNYFDAYPDKTFVLEFTSKMSEKDFALVEDYKSYMPNLLLCVATPEDGIALGLPYYLGWRADSFYEAEALKKTGVAYVRPGMSMMFDVAAMQNLDMPVRLTPNVAYESNVPECDGICGYWIRPEDLHEYEVFGPEVVIEFEADRGLEEEALYRIYAEEHEFSGPMDMLIKRIGVSCPNRMVPPSLVQVRLVCRQRCKQGQNCKLCHTVTKLIQVIRDPESLAFLQKK